MSKKKDDAISSLTDQFLADAVPESSSTSEETQSVEESAEMPNELSDFFSDSEVESEEEAVEEESAEDEQEEESEEDSTPDLPDVETVKADGKMVKIDYTDRDHIKRVYQKYVAQARYQSERDTARKELAEVKESAAKNDELIGLLNSHIDDPQEMYRLITGGKDLKDQFKEWQKEEDKFHLMSESEKKAYLSAKEVDKRQKDLEKREAAIQRQLQESEEKKLRANRDEQQSMVTSSFEKHRFNEVDDPIRAEQLDRRLWNDVVSKLSKYDSINREIVEKEMKEASETLRSIIGTFSKTEKKKAVSSQKKTAKKAAAQAVAEPTNPESPMIANLKDLMGI